MKCNERGLSVGFAVGTGRCGTKCISELMEEVEGVAAVHELNPQNETFHRFCKWYGLPVDNRGFIYQKEREIAALSAGKHAFFEASAYLSFSIIELYQAFDAKFVLMIRSPEKVVNSYKRKGWYETPVQIDSKGLIPGYQPNKQFHHYLGRTLPKDMDFDVWNGLSTVGKLAWYWSSLNYHVIDLFKKIPSTNWRIQKLEDLDYECFHELCDFLGEDAKMPRGRFEEIVNSKPNSFDNVPTTDDWSPKERSEFSCFISEAADTFGYSIGRK